MGDVQMVNEILSDYMIRDPFLKFPELLGQGSCFVLILL